ncbi:hypothetical protein CM49_02621 [Paenibacillus sp. P1XP2]|nr:hypothetical protein CM49_02621 [Paenibacillus sp. P1XP2]
MQPMIQIRQSPALIGMESGLGEYSIRQPRADLTIATERSELGIQHENPRVTIDQSKAWAAYTGGSVIEMNNRIYSGVREIFCGESRIGSSRATGLPPFTSQGPR